MKVIKNKYNKEDIAILPRSLFEGQVHVVISERETEAAINFLMKQPIVGIDTETRPSFRKGTMHKVALLQVSTHEVCFLFRLNRIGFPQPLIQLFESADVTKVGLSLNDDIRALRKRQDFTPQNFIDIQDEVKKLGIQDLSLQKIYANIFGMKIAKTQQLSNWEAESLSESQKLYASTDAWACIMLHEEIQRLIQTGNFKLEIVPSPSPDEVSEKS